MDIGEVQDFDRTCCYTYSDQQHESTCPRMIALDESFKKDTERMQDSLKFHSATYLHQQAVDSLLSALVDIQIDDRANGA